VLKGAVSDGAHDLGLEHEVAEARAVQAHVLVLAALCRAARRAALGGARALVPLLFFIVGVWGTVLVYALCCRPKHRRAAAGEAAAAAAPGSPAAAAAAPPPPPPPQGAPGTPASPAPSPLRAPAGEAQHFARALQLPAASLLESSLRLQAPARRDGLLLAALAAAGPCPPRP
jgi:hypothetical protein